MGRDAEPSTWAVAKPPREGGPSTQMESNPPQEAKPNTHMESNPPKEVKPHTHVGANPPRETKPNTYVGVRLAKGSHTQYMVAIWARGSQTHFGPSPPRKAGPKAQNAFSINAWDDLRDRSREELGREGWSSGERGGSAQKNGARKEREGICLG